MNASFPNALTTGDHSSPTPSRLPLQALCKTIKALVAKGDHASEKAEQFYIAAGKHLVELKEREPSEWEKIAKQKIGIGRSRAYEYIALADGRKSLTEIREKGVERIQKHRASCPLRNGQTGSSLAVSFERADDNEDIEADIEPARITAAFLLRADQAARFAIFSGSVTAEAMEAARRAAGAWNVLVEHMEKNL